MVTGRRNSAQCCNCSADEQLHAYGTNYICYTQLILLNSAYQGHPAAETSVHPDAPPSVPSSCTWQGPGAKCPAEYKYDLHIKGLCASHALIDVLQEAGSLGNPLPRFRGGIPLGCPTPLWYTILTTPDRHSTSITLVELHMNFSEFATEFATVLHAHCAENTTYIVQLTVTTKLQSGHLSEEKIKQ